MAEKEDYSNNPLYNRELLKPLLGTRAFSTPEPSEAPAPVAPTPPRRPAEPPPAVGEVTTDKRTPEQRLRDEEQAREAYEKMTAPPVPGGKSTIAAASGFGETLAPGVFPSIVSAGAQTLGKIGVPGYERFAEQPPTKTREEVVQMGEQARKEAPVAGAVGTAGGLATGMATLPVLAAGKSPFVSGLLTGGAYGALAGASKENELAPAIMGAVKEGLIGAGVGALGSAAIEHTASGISRLMFGGRPVVDAQGNLTEEATRIATEAGLTPEQISVLAPQLVQTFEQRGLTKEAAREAPFREFGIEPKRGMVEESPEQLTHEIKHGDYGPIAEQAKEAGEEFAFQGAPVVGVREAVDAAIARGEANARSLKSQYEAAYKTAEQAPGKFEREAITNVGDRLLQNLAVDVNAQHLYHDPIVQQAAQQLNKSLGQTIEGPGGVKILWQNFPAVEGGRKSLNSLLAKAQTPTEKAGVRRMIDEYDKYVESKLLDGSFSGAPNVVNDWRKARKLFSDYQQKYGIKKTGEDAGKLMKDIIEQNRDPDSIARMMFNFAGSGDVTAKASALKVYNQLRRALGPNSPELDTIKKSFVSQLMTPVLRTGEKATPGHFTDTAKQIDNFLRGNTASFAKNVLSDAERATLSRFADVMRTAGRKPAELTPEKLGLFSQAMWFSAPAIAETITGIANATLPGNLKTPFLVAAGAYARKKAIQGSELAAEAAANLPPRNIPRVYRYPEVRPLLPLTAEAYQREGRATGGKVGMTASMLIQAVDRAKNKINNGTKEILKAPDEHVVKALEIAKQNI